MDHSPPRHTEIYMKKNKTNKIKLNSNLINKIKKKHPEENTERKVENQINTTKNKYSNKYEINKSLFIKKNNTKIIKVGNKNIKNLEVDINKIFA